VLFSSCLPLSRRFPINQEYLQSDDWQVVKM
jgi:hypothetical protein